MKRFATILFIIPLSGCLVDVLTTTAIQGELAAENASAASRALDKAKDTAGQVSANNAALIPEQPITPADQQAKEKIRRAINAYGQAVGYYPPSLQALVQYGYLETLPKTSAGHDFIFYPENGALYHPAELAATQHPPQHHQAQPNRGSAPAGGAGLMGETMTGIGVQNQLNNMNNSGVSNAGNAARAGTRNKSAGYSDKQMQTLKDLDLDR